VSARYVAAKLLGSFATLAFVVVFNFFLFRVIATDPVANLFRGRNLTDDQRAELRSEFGLDGSQLDQFWSYLQQTASLNFGRSYITNEPVMAEIADKAPATIALVGVSAVLSAVIGIAIGVVAAWRRRSKTDYAATTTTMTLYSMPDFWLGMLLLSLFAVTLGWFPIGGLDDPSSDATGIGLLAEQAHHMFLPALTLTLAYLGEYALVMRSSLIDTMREDYLVLARAKGMRDVMVRNRHAVPNALLPVVTLIAINFGFVLSGGGDDLLLAGSRLCVLRGDPRARPADAPGPVPRVQCGGHRVQPARRPALCGARPTGADMSAVAVPSPRRIAWQRRRRALAGVWDAFRHDRAGMAGLIILALFVASQLAAIVVGAWFTRGRGEAGAA
jgi:peptide/nickel transport system permease protein